MRQLLEHAQPYNIILGARNTQRTKEAYDALKYDRDSNPVTILPLEMNDLRNVQSFASQVQQTLQGVKLDYVLLNAGITGSTAAAPNGSKWCEPYVVNHLCEWPCSHRKI
jgi:NADP-dependent 3-hydroxy acid dehydrogenase YdfG